jgi:hypothetical protein
MSKFYKIELPQVQAATENTSVLQQRQNIPKPFL